MKLIQELKTRLTRLHPSDELKDQIKYTLLGLVGLGVPMVLLTNYTGSHPLTITAIAVVLASFGGVFEGYLVRQDTYERKIESVYDMWHADARRLRQELKDWESQTVLDTARLCELRTELEDALSKVHYRQTKDFKEKVDEPLPNETLD